LASELRKNGDEVFFLAHDSNAKLLEGVPHLAFSCAASPLFQLYISSCLSKFRASSIILSDYFTTTLFFDSFGLDPGILTSFGLPILAIDTWDSCRTLQRRIDVLVGEYRERTLWPGKVMPVSPVPFLAPHTSAGFYCSLPTRVSVTRKVRRHLHHALGMDSSSKAVLFCTAEWQHPNYESRGDVARRCGRTLPLLVADYISRVGEKVHLVHIGPEAYQLNDRLPGRYHWLPPLTPTEFDMFLASMDLVLSANISATTLAKAMVFGVPALVLQNSIAASTSEEARAAIEDPPSSQLATWLEEAVPIFPFALWPIGYHAFMTPLMRNNPYVEALDIVELLQERKVEEAMAGLLFHTAARESQLHRQTLYLDQVRNLPTGPEVVHAALTQEVLQ
jgi:hypothetical protein